MVKDGSWTSLVHNWVKEGAMYTTKDTWGDGDLNILIFICCSGIQLAMSGGQAIQGLPMSSTSVSFATQPVNRWHASLALCS